MRPITIFSLLICTLLLPFGGLMAQRTLTVDQLTHESRPETWDALTVAAPELMDKFQVREALLDLVEICSSHPDFEAKKCYQSGMAGFSTLDKNRFWEAIEMSKQKFVGTSIEPSKFFHSVAVPKERDICVYAVPHLPHYIEMAERGLKKADRKRSGQKKISKYPLVEEFTEGGCDCAEPLTAKKKKKEYCRYVELECTWEDGNDSLRKELVEQFAPPLKSIDPKEELKSSLFLPTGVYGPFVSDCVHNCKPEIHPYEWIWWMEFDKENPVRKSWKVGFIRDQSKRYTKWAPQLLEGRASIPFAVPKGKTLYMQVEPLVHNELVCISLACEASTGELPLALLEEQTTVSVDQSNTKIVLSSKTERPLRNGVAFSLSHLNEDPKTGLLTGYLNIAVSARTVFTARVTTDLQPIE